MPGIEDFLTSSASGFAVPDAAVREQPGGKGQEDPLSAQPTGASAVGSSPTWILPIERFSASSLNMLAVCPRQFQQRYLKGRKEAPAQAQIQGSVFHDAMEYNFRQKIVTYEDLPTDEIVEYMEDEGFDKVIQENQEDTGAMVIWDTTEDAARTVARDMVVGYRNNVAPSVLPREVEYRFSQEVTDVPVPLVGMVDVVEDCNIIDLKSSKRKVNMIKPGWRIQGRVYQLYKPLPVQFHVVTTKGETLPKLQMQYSLREWAATESWIHKLAWTANFYYTMFGDEEWPALGIAHDWRCGWCAYKSDCPAWRGT